ncbi:MAG: hypothetical protein ABL907_01725 [Hyphomicrobium sp.]
MDHYQSGMPFHPRQDEIKAIELTLDDGLRAISTSPSVKATERIRSCSRLKAFARVVGKPLQEIAASPQNIRQLIAKAKPGAHNYRTSYWKVICGSVWFALRLLGIDTIGRTAAQVPETWKPLLAPLPHKPHRLTLSPLIRAVTALGIAPPELDQSASLAVREYFRRHYKRKTWQRAYRKALGIVKSCQKEYPELWPQHPIEVVFENDHYTLDWSEFPSLESETDHMIAQLLSRSNGVMFEESTAIERKYAVLKIASALVHRRGRGPSSISSLSDIANRDAVENYIDFILHRGGNERSGYLSQTCRHAIAIAKYHSKADKEEIEALQRIKKTVNRPRSPTH